MSYNKSRVPLNMQYDLSKAKKGSDSWETFRPHQVHEVKYQHQKEDRPSTHAMSVIRRNPDGKLDYEWAKQKIVSAIHGMQFPESLRPIDLALLAVIFPNRFNTMESMQAEILTQFSDSEKDIVREMVEAHMHEEENWNAGQGGGSVEGRYKTRTGIP